MTVHRCPDCRCADPVRRRRTSGSLPPRRGSERNRRIARRLRFLADRVDPTSGPRVMTAVNGFTFEGDDPDEGCQPDCAPADLRQVASDEAECVVCGYRRPLGN